MDSILQTTVLSPQGEVPFSSEAVEEWKLDTGPAVEWKADSIDPKVLKMWMTAAQKDDIHTIETLIQDNPAILDAREGMSGMTALHRAAETGSLTVCTRLLTAKPSLVKDRDAWGNQPMHIGALAAQIDVVRLLIDNGASPTALNDEMKSPVDMANGDYLKELLTQWAVISNENREENELSESGDKEKDREEQVEEGDEGKNTEDMDEASEEEVEEEENNSFKSVTADLDNFDVQIEPREEERNDPMEGVDDEIVNAEGEGVDEEGDAIQEEECGPVASFFINFFLIALILMLSTIAILLVVRMYHRATLPTCTKDDYEGNLETLNCMHPMITRIGDVLDKEMFEKSILEGSISLVYTDPQHIYSNPVGELYRFYPTGMFEDVEMTKFALHVIWKKKTNDENEKRSAALEERLLMLENENRELKKKEEMAETERLIAEMKKKKEFEMGVEKTRKFLEKSVKENERMRENCEKEQMMRGMIEKIKDWTSKNRVLLAFTNLFLLSAYLISLYLRPIFPSNEATVYYVDLKKGEEGYGIIVKGRVVKKLVPGGAAEVQGRLKEGDEIVGVNEMNTETLRPTEIVDLIAATKKSVRLWMRENTGRYYIIWKNITRI